MIWEVNFNRYLLFNFSVLGRERERILERRAYGGPGQDTFQPYELDTYYTKDRPVAKIPSLLDMIDTGPPKEKKEITKQVEPPSDPRNSRLKKEEANQEVKAAKEEPSQGAEQQAGYQNMVQGSYQGQDAYSSGNQQMPSYNYPYGNQQAGYPAPPHVAFPPPRPGPLPPPPPQGTYQGYQQGSYGQAFPQAPYGQGMQQAPYQQGNYQMGMQPGTYQQPGNFQTGTYQQGLPQGNIPAPGVPQPHVAMGTVQVPQGTVVPQGTGVPQGTAVAQGTTVPQGTAVAQGTPVAQGVVGTQPHIPQGNVPTSVAPAVIQTVMPQATVQPAKPQQSISKEPTTPLQPQVQRGKPHASTPQDTGTPTQIGSVTPSQTPDISSPAAQIPVPHVVQQPGMVRPMFYRHCQCYLQPPCIKNVYCTSSICIKKLVRTS